MEPDDALTRFARIGFYLGAVLFLLMAGGVLRVLTEPDRGPSVRFTGTEDSEAFVCGRLKPGELTCLDIETYVERVKAQKAGRADL